jgi:hypothetical protein
MVAGHSAWRVSCAICLLLERRQQQVDNDFVPIWDARSEYGYRASHSRYFWGLRLHLVATLGGLPVAFALTGAKADERQTLLGMLAADPALAADRPGQTVGAENLCRLAGCSV